VGSSRVVRLQGTSRPRMLETRWTHKQSEALYPDAPRRQANEQAPNRSRGRVRTRGLGSSRENVQPLDRDGVVGAPHAWLRPGVEFEASDMCRMREQRHSLRSQEWRVRQGAVGRDRALVPQVRGVHSVEVGGVVNPVTTDELRLGVHRRWTCTASVAAGRIQGSYDTGSRRIRPCGPHRLQSHQSA
jgi:hypothetical protein